MRGRRGRVLGMPYVILQGSPGDGMANTIDNDIGGVIAAAGWRCCSWPSQRRQKKESVSDGNERESDNGDEDATTNYYSTRTASDGATAVNENERESSKDKNENVVEEDTITTSTNYYSTTAINSIISQWQDECTLIEQEQMKEFTCDVRSLLKQRRKQHRRHQQHHCSITNNDDDNGDDCNNSNGREKNYRQQTTIENGAPPPPCNGSCCNGSSQTKKTTSRECRDYDDDDFEVAQNHYIWYQKHGRLIVFDTLPSPSSLQQQVDDDSVITTLSPGTIVMVNKIYILDSRTMQILLVRNVVANEEEEEEKDAGTNYNVNDHNDKCIQQEGHSRRRHYCHTNNNSQPITTTIPTTITMLEITSPRNGYIVGSIHSYPLVLRGLPELYTNINNSEVVNYDDDNYNDDNIDDCKEDKDLVVGAATSQQQPVTTTTTTTTTTTQRKWLWRITNYPDGAYVRTGPELSTRHIATLNYGAVCNLTCKIVNNMGLNRLRIEFTTSTDTTTTTNTATTTAPTTIYSALENDFDINTNEKSDTNNNNTTATALPTSSRVKGVVSGYISQYLNPLSGQRGCIAYPISFPRPALYEIIYPDKGGLAVHSNIELSSRINTYIPRGAIVCITGRGYTNHPRSECVERLRLAGGAGWISSAIVIPESVTGASLSSSSCTNNNDDKNNKKLAHDGNTSLQCDNDNNNTSTVSFTVRMVGIDPTFDPDNPGRFHFHATRMVMEGLLYPPLTTADTNEINHYCSKHNEHNVVDKHHVGIVSHGGSNDKVQSEMTGTRSNTGNIFSQQTQSNELHKKDQLSSIGNMESVDLASSVLLDMSLTDYTRQQQHHVTASEDSIVLTSSQHTIPPRCNTLNSTIQESTSFVYGHNNRRITFDSNNRCLICLSDERTSTIVHGETGHIACCLACARILKARGDNVSEEIIIFDERVEPSYKY